MRKILYVILTLTLLLLFTALPVEAGRVKGGFKFGFNVAHLAGDDVTITGKKPGGLFGIFLNIKLLEYFQIQPEVYLTQKGGRNQSTVGVPQIRYREIIKLKYTEVPVLLKLSTSSTGSYNDVHLFLGPFLGFVRGVTFIDEEKCIDLMCLIEVNRTEENIESEYKNVDFGLVVGAGFDINLHGNLMLIFDGRYSMSLISIYSGNGDVKNRMFSFLFGFMFPGKEVKEIVPKEKELILKQEEAEVEYGL